MPRGFAIGLGTFIGVWLAPRLSSPDAVPLCALLALLASHIAWSILATRRRERTTQWMVVSSALAAGVCLGWLATVTQPQGPRLRGLTTVVGVVATQEGGRHLQILVTRSRAPHTPWHRAQGRMRLTWPDTPPPIGTPVVATGMARTSASVGTPGAPSRVMTDTRARIRTHLVATTAASLGTAPRAEPLRPLPGLLKALATGSRDELDDQLVAVMRATGTAHLLAISGFHVGTIALAAAWFAGRVLALKTLVEPSGASEAPRHVAAVAAACLFTISVGMPVSAQRACGMIMLAMAARAGGRCREPRALLGLVATALLSIDPAIATQVSFQLSFGAVVGLIYWAPVLQNMAPTRGPWPIPSLTVAATASIAATIGTLPAAAWWFQSLSITSPLANVLAMPIASLVLVPCALIGAWIPGPLGDLAVTIGALGTETLQFILTGLSLPVLHPAVGPLGAASLGLALLLPRHLGLAGWMTLISLGLRRTHHGLLVLTFLDVGHGDCILVHHADGRRTLIDTGSRWAGVAAWLRREGHIHLASLTLTHHHDDHAGGALEIVRSLRVDEIRGDLPPKPSTLAHLATEHEIPWRAEAELRLWPPAVPDEATPDDNSLSWVTVIGRHRHRALLTGDIEAPQERLLAPMAPHVDVLKLPHHGSQTSSTRELLDATRPRLAVVQASRANPPAERVRRRLHNRQIPLLRTDLHGTIEVAFRPGRIVYRTHRPRSGWATWRTVQSITTPASTHHDGPFP